MVKKVSPPAKKKLPAKQAVVKKSPSVKKKQPPLTAQDKLAELGVDKICERIASGESQASIARSLGVNCGTFSTWLADDDKRSARAKEARSLSSQHWDDIAYEAVDNLEHEASPGDIARAREVAQHCRWRAKVYNPADYSDATTLRGDPKAPLQVKHTADLSNLTEEELAVLEKLTTKIGG